MDDSFWWAAYILAGIITVMAYMMFYEHLYKHHMDGNEKREAELNYSIMKANPAAKAFLYIVIWLFWPLIVLAAIISGLILLFFAAWDIWDMFVAFVRRLVARIKAKAVDN